MVENGATGGDKGSIACQRDDLYGGRPRSIPNTSSWEPGLVGLGSAWARMSFTTAPQPQRLIDIVVRMREGDEQVFERMGMKQHAAVQHSLPPPPEVFMACVTGGVAVVADGCPANHTCSTGPIPTTYASSLASCRTRSSR